MLKLPHHKRYDFLPITKRKHYTWPGGKRLAFYVALNIEHFAFQAGLGIDPHNRTGPQTSRNYAWRDYGNRVGNWRFFEILDELKLPASILLNSAVCYEYPEIVEKIKQRGDDLLGHGRTNAEVGGRRAPRHPGMRRCHHETFGCPADRLDGIGCR
jgi:peptidoglycan/xylan/chitin deacetylase (PgdA/CDA1 family)